MATVSKWNPFGVALDLTATAGTVTRKSAEEFEVVINASWECYYSGGATNFGMKVTSGGKTIYIPEFDGDKYKSSGSGTLTGTYSISGNGAQTKSISVVFDNYKTSPVKSATKTITLSVDVPAWTSYTIKYNANGGSGAPGNQTKWEGQALTLSSTKPTRAGHDFLGWSTSSTATSAAYSAGDTYPAESNANATLYAVWKAHTYQVTFNANGGTGAPDAQTKTYGKTLTLSSTKPTRTNYNFLGWGTSASSTTVAYAAGGSYTANAAATLYAVWELAYSKPRITNFTAVRCDYQGNIIDNGTYLSIRFDWVCDRPVESIIVNIYDTAGNPVPDQYGDIGGFNFTPEYEDVTSGTESLYVYDLENIGFGSGDPGPCDTDKTYTVRVTVTDEIDSYNKSVTVNGLIFPIDFLAGGKGVAFGKPAELAGYADFDYNALLKNNAAIFGRGQDGTIKEVFKPQNSNGNTVIGYGNYDNASGSTNIYGHDVYLGVSNLATPDTYRPYIRRGDTMTLTLRCAGYVTSSGKEVFFWIPTSVPIIGSPTATVTSGSGFILRQGDKYTHGSSGSAYVTPSSYEATPTMFNGICVKAVFSNATNVTNNDAIGIQWNGTITFS